MRVLWIATKVPVPPVDGGRLLQRLTLEALAAAGARVTLVAPCFPAEDRAAAENELSAFVEPRLVSLAPRSLLHSLVDSRPGGRPWTVARHARRELRREVAELVRTRSFDVVHAEQLQALEQAMPALRRGVPVVLRAQNVESDLWRDGSRLVPPPGRWLLQLESRRLARWEGAAVRGVTRAVTLTERDAERLRCLAEGRRGSNAERIGVVPPPFPDRLPAGELALAGEPAVVVMGSAAWPPNRDAADWMAREVWPSVRRRAPGAVLHLFAGRPRDQEGELGIVHHPPLEHSAAAFAPGAVLAVPLRVASGIRMKILEAWARGLAVVATPTAAAGLEARDGRELMVADAPGSFAAAVARLAEEPGLATALTARGRRLLRQRHDPADVAQRLLEVYRVAARGRDGTTAAGAPRQRRGMIAVPRSRPSARGRPSQPFR